MAHPSGQAHVEPAKPRSMKRKITIIFDDPGLGPEDSIAADVVAILELMLPYMIDNIDVIYEDADRWHE